MKAWFIAGALALFTAGAKAQDKTAELERKIDLLTQEVEKMRLGSAAGETEYRAEKGFGPAASKIYRVDRGVSVGGYGEVVYQANEGQTPTTDAQRLILYFGYKWDDRLLFNSEIEFEHAFVKDNVGATATASSGEVAVEFAYVDYKLLEPVNLRAGLLLLPLGILNELHEPPTFHGVQRNEVERQLIPTTWRENGVGLFGTLGPVSYRTYLVNGLKGSKFSSSGLRDARQLGSKAQASDVGLAARMDLPAGHGLDLSASAYTGKSGQRMQDAAGDIDAWTTLAEAHASWRRRGLELRALYASAWVGDAARLNAKLGLGATNRVAERMEGYYGSAAFDVLSLRGSSMSLSPFYRFESLDTQADMPAGSSRNAARDQTIHTLGLKFQPISNVSFTVDYQDFENGANTGVNRWNAGVGWLF